MEEALNKKNKSYEWETDRFTHVLYWLKESWVLFFQTLQRSVEKSRPKSILATDFKCLHSMVSFGGASSSSDQLVSFLCKEQAHATGIQ